MSKWRMRMALCAASERAPPVAEPCRPPPRPSASEPVYMPDVEPKAPVDGTGAAAEAEAEEDDAVMRGAPPGWCMSAEGGSTSLDGDTDHSGS
jgi:hypothetical protein